MPKLGNTLPIRYYRFQARLDEAQDDMDDASPNNIHMLKVLGRSIIQDRTKDIADIAQLLTMV